MVVIFHLKNHSRIQIVAHIELVVRAFLEARKSNEDSRNGFHFFYIRAGFHTMEQLPPITHKQRIRILEIENELNSVVECTLK